MVTQRLAVADPPELLLNRHVLGQVQRPEAWGSYRVESCVRGRSIRVTRVCGAGEGEPWVGGGQGAIRGDQEGFTGGGAATGGIHITVSQVQLVEAAQTLTLTRALPIEDVNSTLGSSQRFWKQLTTCRHLTRKITHCILSQTHRG